jgi:hypothetical protein
VIPLPRLSLPLALDNTSKDEGRPAIVVRCYRCDHDLLPGAGVQVRQKPGLAVIVHPECA